MAGSLQLGDIEQVVMEVVHAALQGALPPVLSTLLTVSYLAKVELFTVFWGKLLLANRPSKLTFAIRDILGRQTPQSSGLCCPLTSGKVISLRTTMCTSWPEKTDVLKRNKIICLCQIGTSVFEQRRCSTTSLFTHLQCCTEFSPQTA